MSEKTESRIMYIVFAFMIIGSFAGMIIPLMNPSAYADLLMSYPIPLVQQHIEFDQCNQLINDHIDIKNCELKGFIV